MTLIVLMTMLPPYVCAFHFPWLMVAFLPRACMCERKETRNHAERIDASKEHSSQLPTHTPSFPSLPSFSPSLLPSFHNVKRRSET